MKQQQATTFCAQIAILCPDGTEKTCRAVFPQLCPFFQSPTSTFFDLSCLPFSRITIFAIYSSAATINKGTKKEQVIYFPKLL